jgi:hypothetical protein
VSKEGVIFHLIGVAFYDYFCIKNFNFILLLSLLLRILFPTVLHKSDVHAKLDTTDKLRSYCPMIKKLAFVIFSVRNFLKKVTLHGITTF